MNGEVEEAEEVDEVKEEAAEVAEVEETEARLTDETMDFVLGVVLAGFTSASNEPDTPVLSCGVNGETATESSVRSSRVSTCAARAEPRRMACPPTAGLNPRLLLMTLRPSNFASRLGRPAR